MNRSAVRFWAFLLTLSILLSLAACGGSSTTAATMHLRRTEGTVSVSDGDGKDVPVLNNLGLYSGYGVGTRSDSYAWIDLDDVKLTKQDQNSEISIQKEGKALEIEVKSGSLFFNVTEPLAEDETMNIRASTMLIGIRGTCGWVEENGGLPRVYLLEGEVECTVGENTVTVTAGEVGRLDETTGTVTVEPFAQDAIPGFVRGELDGISLDSIPETMEPAIPAESGFAGHYIQHVEPHVLLDIEFAPDGTLQAHWTAEVLEEVGEGYYEPVNVEVYRSAAQVVGETLVVQVPAASGTAILTIAMWGDSISTEWWAEGMQGDDLMVTMQGDDSMITEWWAVSEIAGPYVRMDMMPDGGYAELTWMT